MDRNVTHAYIFCNSRTAFSLPAVAPFPCHHSWVLFRGTPLNPLHILTNRYLHRFTPQPTFQTRSKYGPTLQVSYVVLPFITSRPLRLPCAPHTFLAGFTQLESCLPQLESCGDAGISGPTSVIFHRMPLAIPRVPIRCIRPLLPRWLWPSPNN